MLDLTSDSFPAAPDPSQDGRGDERKVGPHVTRFTLTHTISCSEDTFWALYLDTEFTVRLITEGLGFEACRVEELRDDGATIHRTTVAQPKLELPDAVAKLLGPRLSYREEGTFDKARRTWEWTTHLAVLSDKIQLGGTMRTRPEGNDRCVRIADLWVRARIFALGGLVEKAAERNLRKGWQTSADWMNEELRTGRLVPPTPEAATTERATTA